MTKAKAVKAVVEDGSVSVETPDEALADFAPVPDEVQIGDDVAPEPERDPVAAVTEEVFGQQVAMGWAGKKTITRCLRCPMTDNDKALLADELAAELTALGDVRDQAKAVASTWKDRIKGREATVKDLVDQIESGEINREIPCEVHEFFNLKTVKVMRLDTGEFFESRPMTEKELEAHQTELPLDGAEQLAGETAAAGEAAEEPDATMCVETKEGVFVPVAEAEGREPGVEG